MSERLPELRLESVNRVLGGWLGIDESYLDLAGGNQASIDKLRHALRGKIFGQEAAISGVCSALRRALLLKRPSSDTRPCGTILLVGPSGSGKSELALAAGRLFFHEERFVKRLDMTEFSSEHTIASLKGAPPGYIGFGSGGELTNFLKDSSHGVILLDEIEKAHPLFVTRFLLPVLEGRVRDMSTGENLDARNFLIVLTSNLGCGKVRSGGRTMGFGSEVPSPADTVRAALEEALPSEFLGRLDATVVFEPLSLEAARLILGREIGLLEERMRSRHPEAQLRLSPLVEKIVLAKAKAELGAQGGRAVLRAFAENVEDRVMEMLAGHDAGTGPCHIASDVTPAGQMRFFWAAPASEAGKPSGIEAE